MIVYLLIVLGVLLVLLWISSMYIWWRSTTPGVHTPPLNAAVYIHLYEKIIRLLRRGVYRILFYLEQVLRWSMSKVTIVFFRIFPSARTAFKKQDELTGLKKGPSSYFLYSLSEDGSEEENTTHRKRRNKKVV